MNLMQQRALDHTSGPLLILAGAGSGKTRVLTHKIAKYIQKLGVHPENILAITFTNKAAGEMKERTINLLEGDFDSSKLWISTFHSMCVRILRKNATDIGYRNSFAIYDEADTKSVMKEVISALLSPPDQGAKDFLHAISTLKNSNIHPKEIMYEQE